MIQQRGYLYVPVTGTCTFTITRTNEIGFLWLGGSVYSGYNRGNAVITLGGGVCSSAPIYVPLAAGQYFPIRYMTFHDQDLNRVFILRIVRPDCQVLLDHNSMPGGDYFVQFSSDGDSGRAFPAFGAGG